MTDGEGWLLAVAFSTGVVGFVLAVVLGFTTAAGTGDLRRDLDEVRQQLCAWRFEEDGSASVRSDDFERFRCMGQYGYRAR